MAALAVEISDLASGQGAAAKGIKKGTQPKAWQWYCGKRSGRSY